MEYKLNINISKANKNVKKLKVKKVKDIIVPKEIFSDLLNIYERLWNISQNITNRYQMQKYKNNKTINDLRTPED